MRSVVDPTDLLTVAVWLDAEADDREACVIDSPDVAGLRTAAALLRSAATS